MVQLSQKGHLKSIHVAFVFRCEILQWRASVNVRKIFCDNPFWLVFFKLMNQIKLWFSTMSTLPIHYYHDACIIMSIHIIEHILHNWGLACVKIARVSLLCMRTTVHTCMGIHRSSLEEHPNWGHTI